MKSDIILLKKLAIVLLVVLALSSFVAYNSYAQEKMIPSWMKNTFKFYSEDQISDQELINALQWLVNNDILKIPQKSSSITDFIGGSKSILYAEEGFSDLTCIQNPLDLTIITLNGHYTNGQQSKMLMEIFLGIIDQNDKVISTGYTPLSNLEPGEKRLILVAGYLDVPQPIKGCEVRIGNQIIN